MRDEWVAWLEPVRALAAEASARILEIYATAFGVTAKDDNSPLTAADLAAHHAIVAGLQRLTPDIPILSEESASIPFAERSRWRRFWLVDPLDGTKEFIQRNGQFTVNIALIENHEPVLGVVRVPVTGLCYFAARGCGAFREEPGQPPQPIKVKPLQADGPVRVVGSRSHGGPGLQKFVAAVGAHESGHHRQFAEILPGGGRRGGRVSPARPDLGMGYRRRPVHRRGSRRPGSVGGNRPAVALQYPRFAAESVFHRLWRRQPRLAGLRSAGNESPSPIGRGVGGEERF